MMPTPLKGIGLIADVVLNQSLSALPHSKLNYKTAPEEQCQNNRSKVLIF